MPSKTGQLLALMHVIIFVLFLIYLSSVYDRDGQAILLWAYWLILDFPVSLLLLLGWDLMGSSETQIMIFLRYYLPHFVHGVLGTIWWLYLPSFIQKIWWKLKGLASRNK